MLRFLLLCLLAALSATRGNAFVSRDQTRRQCLSTIRPPRTTVLVRASGVEDQLPANWRQLPSKPQLPEKQEPKAEMSGAEIYIGRIAMVGFVGLLVGEFLRGESFTQQFLEAFQFFIGSK